MVTLEIFENDASARILLERLQRDMPWIDRKLRVAFALEIVGEVQKNYLRGQVLHRSTGKLASHIAYKDASEHETMVGAYGVVYARIHELGGDIYPKRKPMLAWRPKTFIMMHYSAKTHKMRAQQHYGGWIFAKHVRIPKRPYLLPGILNYFKSGRAEKTADFVLGRELENLRKA
jgi:phage gpG-like protein